MHKTSETQELRKDSEIIRLPAKVFDLRRVFAATMAELGVKANRENRFLATEIDPSIPRYFHGCPDDFAQIISLLLSYALKSKQSDGVTVTVSSPGEAVNKGHLIDIVISGNGLGLFAQAHACTGRRQASEPAVAHIIQPLWADILRAKKIAGQYAGNIRMETVFGWGTRFFVSLYLQQALSWDQQANSA